MSNQTKYEASFDRSFAHIFKHGYLAYFYNKFSQTCEVDKLRMYMRANAKQNVGCLQIITTQCCILSFYALSQL